MPVLFGQFRSLGLQIARRAHELNRSQVLDAVEPMAAAQLAPVADFPIRSIDRPGLRSAMAGFGRTTNVADIQRATMGQTVMPPRSGIEAELGIPAGPPAFTPFDAGAGVTPLPTGLRRLAYDFGQTPEGTFGTGPVPPEFAIPAGIAAAGRFSEQVRTPQDKERIVALRGALGTEGLAPQRFIEMAQTTIGGQSLKDFSPEDVERYGNVLRQLRNQGFVSEVSAAVSSIWPSQEELGAMEPPGPSLDFAPSSLDPLRFPEHQGREVGKILAGAGRVALEGAAPELVGTSTSERLVSDPRHALEALSEGGDVPVAPDVLNPIYWIPIPFIDPLLAAGLSRVLGVLGVTTLKAGMKVAPGVARTIQRHLAKVAVESADPAVREAAERLSAALDRRLQRVPEAAPVAGVRGAPLETGVRRPVGAVGGELRPRPVTEAIPQASRPRAATGELPIPEGAIRRVVQASNAVWRDSGQMIALRNTQRVIDGEERFSVLGRAIKTEPTHVTVLDPGGNTHRLPWDQVRKVEEQVVLPDGQVLRGGQQMRLGQGQVLEPSAVPVPPQRPAAAAAKPAARGAPSLEPIRVGDEVVDTSDRRWRVVDDSDSATFTVENERGTRTRIGRGAVQKAETGPVQAAAAAPPVARTPAVSDVRTIRKLPPRDFSSRSRNAANRLRKLIDDPKTPEPMRQRARELFDKVCK